MSFKKSLAAVAVALVFGSALGALWVIRRGPRIKDGAMGWQTDHIPVAWTDTNMPPTLVLLQADSRRRVCVTLSDVVLFQGVVDPERQDFAREIRLAGGKYDLLVEDLDSAESTSTSLDTRVMRTIEITLSPLRVCTSECLLEPL